jgi:3-deoxy-D-manno-octulosonic-acid transferase
MMNYAASAFVFLYSTALELCRFIVVPPLLLLKASSAWNIRERLGTPPLTNNKTGHTVVWVHAASLGESKLLVKFLDILRRKHPGHAYVLTATTRAGVEYLKTARADRVIAVGFFPFDTIRLMKKMVRQFAVSRVWLMETELWPSMMWVCMRENVPVGMVNARLEIKSFSSYRRIRFLCKPIFSSLDIVLAQSELYNLRFRQLGVRPAAVHIIGNLKNAIDIRRPPLFERNALRAGMKLAAGDFVITAGCLHAGEGRIIREAFDKINAHGSRVKCIVVPRRLAESPSLIKELGPDTPLLKETYATAPWEICLVDKLGVLEDMYRASDAAFVGGTFVSVGGHNVWDAAQFGIPVFFGPDFHTQQESCEKLLRAGVGFLAKSAEELAGLITKFVKTDTSGFAGALSRFIQGVSDRRQEIERMLP